MMPDKSTPAAIETLRQTIEALALELALRDLASIEGILPMAATLAQIAEGFPGPIHIVFGNNDGDPRLLMQVAAKAGRDAAETEGRRGQGRRLAEGRPAGAEGRQGRVQEGWGEGQAGARPT